ncbi:MAG: Hsp33 family molecular chaperone HslO [Succinivibrio sp.]|nr:Hsp33 family molecular chaperone HslO [Succinivibrio sp.]
MITQDTVSRFLFDQHAVRGEIVQLHKSSEAFLASRDYPDCEKKLLLELSCAAVLVSSSLKDGSEIMLQIKGGAQGALKYALVNLKADLTYYGSAVLKEDAQVSDEATLEQLVGTDGIMTMSVFPSNGPKWQGIVPLNPQSISAALEDYFKDSQQLPTRFFIWSDLNTYQTGGILLQIIPEVEHNLESLEHLSILGSTLTSEELFTLSQEDILKRLYAKEDLHLYPAAKVAYQCICSKERCANALKGLKTAELEELIAQGNTEMTCQHCGKVYSFSQAELKSLLLSIQQ